MIDTEGSEAHLKAQDPVRVEVCPRITSKALATCFLSSHFLHAARGTCVLDTPLHAPGESRTHAHMGTTRGQHQNRS